MWAENIIENQQSLVLMIDQSEIIHLYDRLIYDID